ncbi:hypothetical protein [Metabacillus fastidiosus]|uniref:hypothetical protein n=1 Tax=Metabacillus fastidiosus TaxID=1458 RepID=UPI002DB5E89A|nr:hypothetical protein [Metabacillus fastidiosus]MEC2075792.1 hypothetical protein [Metabacillus fastidiosus]
MAYETVFENNLTGTKESKSFEGKVGSIIELEINIKELIANRHGSFQVIIQESEDNENFCDLAMTKVYNAAHLEKGDSFVFKKQKPYHRFQLVIGDGNASVDVELKQNELN